MGTKCPAGENMIKLRDHLHMSIGTDEAAQETNRPLEVGYQLVLPFDQPANFELKVTRKTLGVVQLELRLRGLAS